MEEDPINIEITVPDIDLFVNDFAKRLDECWRTKCTSFCFGFTKMVQQKLSIVTLERKAYFVHFKLDNIVELRFKNDLIFRDDTPFPPLGQIWTFVHCLLFGFCTVEYKNNTIEQTRAEEELKKRQHDEGNKSAKTTKRIRRGKSRCID